MKSIYEFITESMSVNDATNQIKAALDNSDNLGIISSKQDFPHIANTVQGIANEHISSVSDNNVDAKEFENELENTVKNIPGNSKKKVVIINLVNADKRIMNTIMPVVTDKSIKGKKYSNVCFVYVFGKDNEIPAAIEDKLNPITL